MEKMQHSVIMYYTSCTWQENAYSKSWSCLHRL